MSESVSEIIGSTQQYPIWMRLVKDDDDKIRWNRILIALAFTAVSGYLATASQRAGSDIDAIALLKMRLAMLQQNIGRKLTKTGDALYESGCKRFDMARPL